jgi:hypothetical protein
MEIVIKKKTKIISELGGILKIVFFFSCIFLQTVYPKADAFEFNLYKIQENNINPDSTDKLATPTILTKGYGNFIVFHTLEPILKWEEIPGANGYTIYIDEVSDSTRNNKTSFFRSPYYGLITNNTFQIFSDLLEFNKTYKVRIKAYNKTQWSEFSDSVLIRIEFPQLNTPVLYKKSKNKVISFQSNTPIFRWNNIKYANGYTVYVDEISYNKSDTVIISSYYGLVQKNEFIPLDSTLQFGKKYKIRVRAYNQFCWSKYSEPMIFIIGNNKKVSIANNKNKLRLKSFVSDKNAITWGRVNGAEKYHLIVEAKDESNIFGESYSRIIDEEITDTTFILKYPNLKNFRWKINAKINEKETPYTKYYNNIVSLEAINKEKNNETDEVFLRFKYLGMLDEIIVAKFKDDNIYLPLLELLSLLKINHNVDFDKKQIKGSISEENNEKYQIDFKKLLIVKAGKNITLKKNDYIEDELDFYVKPEIINEVLELNIKVDLRQLNLKVKSTNTPLYKRLINKKELSVYRNSLQNKNFPLRYKREKHLFKGIVADYNLSANYVKNQKPYYSYQLGLGTEILGGDVELRHRQTLFENNNSLNQLEARWRYAFLNNRNISSITLGNNNAVGIQSYEYRGIKITNEPLEDRKLFGKHKIEDVTEPEWTVEVYKNNQLIDITKADVNGKFKFYLPFTYGTTLIELHLLGPNGEYKIERKMYQIPINQVPKGNLDYSLNFGSLVSNNEKIFQGKTSYGISDWLTTTMASDVFIDDLKNTSIYNITSARIFSGNIIDLKIAPNALVGVNINSLFPNLANVNIGATLYDKNAKLNPGKMEREINASIFYPIYLGNNSLSFLVRGRKIEYNNSNRFDFSARSYFTYNNFTPSVELRHFNYSGKSRNTEATFLNLRFNYSFILPFRNITGNILDIRLGYNITSESFEQLNLTFSTTLLNKFRVQLTHTTNFNSSFSDTQLRIIYDLPFFRSNTTVSSTIASQSFSGSLSYLQNIKEVEFNNRYMVGKSAAAFRFFLDENGNNIFDANETKIPNVDIEINSVGNKKKREDGTVLINELDAYSNYQTKLIEHRNLNPQWQPVYRKFSFITDPNNYKYIDIPFYEAAEISGSVKKKINGREIPVTGLTIFIENKKSEKIKRLKTLSDGTFYFYGLQPGKYKIYIDSKHLQKIKLKAKPSYFEAEIKSISAAEKNIEFDFVLERE